MSSPEKKSFTTANLRFPATPESTREKKRKTVATPSPSLSDDLVLSCIARMSRLYYPVLSLVSKNFQSLLVSPELGHARSLICEAESCLYVCLRLPPESNPRWFTLCLIPERRKKNPSGKLLVPIPIPSHPVPLIPERRKKDSSGKLLVPVPVPVPLPLPLPFRYLPVQWSNLVAVGSKIYKIGGDGPSSSSMVFVLDCHSQTWHEAPSMRVGRSSSSTISLLDGKIYVAGGCEDCNSVNWIEVFDPKTQTWSSLPKPHAKIRNGGIFKSIGIEGKLYLFGHRLSEIYNPTEGRWNPIGFFIHMGTAPYFSHCVIDNVLFFWYDGRFSWYDYEANLWMVVKGLDCLPDFRHCQRCKLVNYGGKMTVLWDECDNGQVNIWCAEIAIERRDEHEIWGHVEWYDVVLTVPKSCHLMIVDALSATV